jgi:hypothetical protein
MRGMIPELLLRPDVFFSERMKEPESLKFAIIVVLIGAVIAAAGAYVISGIYAEMFAQVPEMGTINAFMGIFGAVSAFFMFIIVWWLVFSGVFFLISMAFSGSGTFRRTLEFTGYGLLPVIIGSAISALISLYYLPMIEVPILSGISDPAALQKVMGQVLADPAFREFTQISSIISVIFLIWSGNLWIFGMKHARSITLKHAAITVLVPVVIYITYALYMAFAGVAALGGA